MSSTGIITPTRNYQQFLHGAISIIEAIVDMRAQSGSYTAAITALCTELYQFMAVNAKRYVLTEVIKRLEDEDYHPDLTLVYEKVNQL